MALQLIYTSAPRLLQAGRTGFGTVAAHPGIPSWLVGEIERASQFSRVPGLDSARVVLRHMIFGQGDRVHHVLSRIQDAGADYTGRTNHIAHHFIFTAAEVTKATALAVTPVDALAFLESHKLWQTSWDGEPRPLDDDTILPVESIPKTITLPAQTYWGALIPGRPECAAILAPGKTSEACWIVYPQGWGGAIVYAMGESLALHSNPWGVSFANDLQPTDNEQQIAWRGIPADSPLLQKAQSSVRPCIDLTNPDALAFQPVPEFTEEARTGKKPQPKSRAAAPLAAKSQTNSEETPAPAIALLSKTKEGPRRNPYALPLAVMVGILILLLGVGGGIWGYDYYSKQQDIREENERLRSEILHQVTGLNNVPDISKFSDPNELAALLTFLREISNRETVTAEKSLEKLRGFSPEWNDWRSVCNTLWENIKNEEIEKNYLDNLYAKASQGDVLTDEQWDQFQTLAKNLHPEDEKWRNALKALNFLRNTSSDDVSHWMQKREMPETTNGLNLNDQVLKKIHQIKIDEYNKNIADISEENQFREGLAKLLNDWPQGSEQRKFLEEFLAPDVVTNSSQTMTSKSEKFANLGLKPPKRLESKLPKDSESKKPGRGAYLNEFVLAPIYIILDQRDKDFLIPIKPEKWRSLNVNVNQISWNQLHSTNKLTSEFWGQEIGATQFASLGKDSIGVGVFTEVDGNEIPQRFILNANTISKSDNDSNLICVLNNNELLINNEFRNFLRRIYKNKNLKFNIALSLKYQSDLFQNNNFDKKSINFELDEIKIALGDYVASIRNEEKLIKSESDKKKDILAELNNEISELSDQLNKKFPINQNNFISWGEFVEAVKEKIAKAEKEKLEVKQFKEVFLNNGAKKIEDFLSKYSDIGQKDQFINSLSKMDDEIKKWFFFEKDKWSEESQKLFKEQFDEKLFKEKKAKIAELENRIVDLNNNSSLEKRISRLNEIKSSIKATLNFYLEESHTEPFLTTEVTIPFSPEQSADAKTPSLSPAP